MRRTQVVAGIVVVAALALVAWWWTRSGDDDAGPLPSRTALVAVGHCVDTPEEEEALLRPTACTEPHEAQVYAEFDLEAGSYPGEEAVVQLAERGCIDRWDRAVGTNYVLDRTFDFVTVVPDSQRWADDVREVACLLVSVDGTPLVGDQLAG